MSCKSCCADCRSEAYWCCKDEWKCNRVRRKMCIHYKKEYSMFKNVTILILVVLLAMAMFDLPENFTMPNIKQTSIENQLLRVVSDIEADRQREQAKIKVQEIVKLLKE